MIGFTEEELAELRKFDAEVESQPAWDPEEVKLQRERDKRFAMDRLTPQQIRKRKHDREYHQRNKERRNAQSAAYAAEHSIEIREYRSQYYAENRESILERQKAYTQANTLRIAQYQHDYHLAHKEEHNSYSREYYLSHREDLLAKEKKRRLENGDRIRAANREYYKRNKERINAERRAKSNPTRRKIFLTHDGKTQSITEWAQELGIKRRTLESRIKRGWSIEKALTASVAERN